MTDYEHAVFISYAWGGEGEEIVNQLDKSLQERGMTIIRDKRDLGFKGSISQFMERIGRGNCVIVVISDKYLRSPNCMFELVEIADGKQFHDRIFPIVLADADIYDPVHRIGYVKHWEAKRAELAAAMKDVDPANLHGIREDMDLYDRIRDKVASLTSILKDMNTLMPDIHRDSDFSQIYDGIEKRMRENAATSVAVVREESKTGEKTRALEQTSDEILWPDGSTMVMLPIDTNGSMAFFISRYPVTNKQYKAFVAKNNAPEPSGESFDRQSSVWRGPFKPWQDPDFSEDSLPVVCVSFEDAQDYCRWVNELCLKDDRKFIRRAKSLIPWVRIWEFAAFGTSHPSLKSEAWLRQTRRIHHKAEFPAPVDTIGIRTNELGVSDLFGNVWEWCSARDETDPYTSSAIGSIAVGSITAITGDMLSIADNNRIDTAERITRKRRELGIELRGGSFLDNLAEVRPFETASRLDDKENTRHSDLGFRICAKVPLQTLPQETVKRLSDNALETWD